eukprot:361852-Chlamydomonas_euryale.AAC.2
MELPEKSAPAAPMETAPEEATPEVWRCRVWGVRCGGPATTSTASGMRLLRTQRQRGWANQEVLLVVWSWGAVGGALQWMDEEFLKARRQLAWLVAARICQSDVAINLFTVVITCCYRHVAIDLLLSTCCREPLAINVLPWTCCH